MANDGISLRRLRDPYLDFVWSEPIKSIEASSETLEVFPGQTDDEVKMDVDSCFVPEESQIGFELMIILMATDQAAGQIVERLNADLKLQASGRKLSDECSESLRQSVRDQLEV